MFPTSITSLLKPPSHQNIAFTLPQKRKTGASNGKPIFPTLVLSTSPASPIVMSISEANETTLLGKRSFNADAVTVCLDTLQSFVHLSSWSSAPPVASPSMLWEVLRALSEACVLLLTALRDGPPRPGESSAAPSVRGVARVATEAAERLHMLEAVVFGQHEAIQRASAAQRQQSEQLVAVSDDIKGLRSKLEHAERDLLVQMDKLRNGVARHSQYVDDALDEIRRRGQTTDEELRNVRLVALDAKAAVETLLLHRDSHRVAETDRPKAVPRSGGIGIAVKEWRDNEAVEIVAVRAASEAEAAGLAAGDIIIAVDDKPCRVVNDLRRVLEGDCAAGSVTVRTLRDGQVLERVLARAPAAPSEELSRASVRV